MKCNLIAIFVKQMANQVKKSILKEMKRGNIGKISVKHRTEHGKKLRREGKENEKSHVANGVIFMLNRKIFQKIGQM